MFVAHERVLARGGGELVIRCRALDARARAQAAAAALARADDREPAAALVPHDAARAHARLVAAGGRGRAVAAGARSSGARGVARRRACALRASRSRRRRRGRASTAARASLGKSSRSVPATLVDRRAADRGAPRRRSTPATGERPAGGSTIAHPARWWPHTHGEPALLRGRASSSAAARSSISAPIGFRTIASIAATATTSRLRVNGVPVFCRGACWTPLDPVTLARRRATRYGAAIAQARDAGMNMLRVGGTMVYESDAFYDAVRRARHPASGRTSCSPTWTIPTTTRRSSPASTREVRAAARAACRRGPSLAVLCGNSEVEQQAAMCGAARERWSAAAVPRGARRRCARERCPDVPYWPSSAHGGAFPHQRERGHDLVLRRRRLPAAARRRAPRRGALRRPSVWRSPTSPSERAAWRPAVRVHHAGVEGAHAARPRRRLGLRRRARLTTSARSSASTRCALRYADPRALPGARPRRRPAR